MSKKLIQKLILRDQTSAAIDLLIDLAPKYSTDSSTENILMNLSSQFYGNENANKIGRISPENYNVAKSRITSYVLEMLEENFKEIGDADIPEKYRALLEDEPTVPAGNDEEGGNGSDSDTVESNVVLFLSANPSNTALLKLRDEHSVIANKLQDSGLKVKSKEAVSFSEFSEAIVNHEPRIVHFSGHGDLESPEAKEIFRTRGIGIPESEEKQGTKNEGPGIILFNDNKRNSHFVSTEVLKELFSSLVNGVDIPIEVVVFNACHSATQAKAVSEAGLTVIGTNNEILDKAAIAFTTGFYFGLAKNKPLDKAFIIARVQAMAQGAQKSQFAIYRDGKKINI